MCMFFENIKKHIQNISCLRYRNFTLWNLFVQIYVMNAPGMFFIFRLAEGSVPLKGQKREMFFWLNPIHLVEKVRYKKNSDHFYPTYPQFCVSWRLLHVRRDSFRVFREKFVFRKQPWSRCIFFIRLKTFHVFFKYAERMKNTREEIFPF